MNPEDKKLINMDKGKASEGPGGSGGGGASGGGGGGGATKPK